MGNLHLFTPEWLQARLIKEGLKSGPGTLKAPAAVEEEAELHNDIIKFCKERGWLYFHGSMAHRTKRVPGEPDFVCLAPEGRVLFIECKSKTGKVSMEQAGVIMQAKKLGHTIHVIDNFPDFIAIINQPKLL